ncbi:hypothetical protein EYF80_058089 [Liparis tanakae]|uniref:Uncharacterized protein n=1 Tax=Liparis tanakae TaxID=230148 RepID=A0A4Z2ESJ4_9TELE|nr:hypothetical protein EYF80_058089 [Liparis tanakae]
MVCGGEEGERGKEPKTEELERGGDKGEETWSGKDTVSEREREREAKRGAGVEEMQKGERGKGDFVKTRKKRKETRIENWASGDDGLGV